MTVTNAEPQNTLEDGAESDADGAGQIGRIEEDALTPFQEDGWTASASEAEPMWSLIERELAADIAAGRLAAGVRLPGEHALAGRFGVNRHTVRQALAALAAKGLVQVRQGLGTFVTDLAVDYVLGRRTRFSENLSAAGLRGRHRFVSSEVIKASKGVAAALDLRPGASVLRVLAVGEANDRPITLGEHHFSARRFKGLDAVFARTGSISAALAEFGVQDFIRRRSAVSARLPGREVAQHLDQDARRPVLLVEGVNVDSAGAPVEFGRTWFAGDLVQLIVDAEQS
ncbi:MAG: phosphonate metabolism transcriptional regulator PhnF [Burkholderiales bacterium]|nr:phosphonate metabolism transcriptional regulator PhnF [Burkholderiales bacterium]